MAQATNKKGWIMGIVVGALGGAVIAGVAVWMIQATSLKELSANLDSTKITLEQTQLQLNQLIANQQVAIEKPPEETDSRKLFTAENMQELLGEGVPCSPLDFNTDPAATTVKFEDKTLGLSVEIPFNNDWGTKDFRILPYEMITRVVESSVVEGTIAETEETTLLHFGPYQTGEGGGCGRRMQLAFEDPMTADAVLAEARAEETPEKTGGAELPNLASKKTINGLTVVEYDHGLICNFPTIEVIGKKHNYKLYSVCAGGYEVLEQAVRSMEFI